jgi:hypothetical protein
MAKPIRDIPKKRRGRPSSGGRRDAILVRLEAGQFSALDSWVAKQAEPITRPEAVRRLIELGLKAVQPTKARRSMPNKLRAAELAAKAIDGIVDPFALPEERAQRRRRLTKGPPEFREHRVDLPKAKGK